MGVRCQLNRRAHLRMTEMFKATLVTFFVAAVTYTSASVAQPAATTVTDCLNSQLQERRSFKDLQEGVQAGLRAEARKLDGNGEIAEPGAKFNNTDVVGPDLPRLRFDVAGENATCAVVSVEGDGWEFGHRIYVLRHASKVWIIEDSRYPVGAAQTLSQLLEIARFAWSHPI